MSSEPSGEALCNCLRKILASLEKGDAVEAAQWTPEMDALVRALSCEISPQELSEAQHLLGRCAELERGMRAHVLGALRQLGAARKSEAYRRIPMRP